MNSLFVSGLIYPSEYSYPWLFFILRPFNFHEPGRRNQEFFNMSENIIMNNGI